MHSIKPLWEQILLPVGEGNPRNSDGCMLALQDGGILLTWSDFYGATGDDAAPARISGMISKDRGRTWGPTFAIQDNPPHVRTYSISPSLLRLPSGAILLSYCQKRCLDTEAPLGALAGEDTVRQYSRLSFDDGRTWGEEVTITPDPIRQFACNDRLVQLHSGRIVLPMTVASNQKSPRRARLWYSDDGGRSWVRGKGQVLLPKRGAMEPVVVERKDGSLLMSMRTQLGDQYRAESYDGGDTWSEGRPMGLVGSEAPAALKRIPGTGDLLIIWNHCFTPGIQHFGRTPLTAAISHDDGETWTRVRDVETDPAHYFAYPSIFAHGDEMLLTYWRAKTGVTGWELKLMILPVGWFYE